MAIESFNQTPADYNSMSFEDLERDEVAGPVLQQKALEYLKIQDKDFFEREFTGELDNEGYLIPKNGSKAIIKPSMNIAGGKAMESVLEMTRSTLGEVR